MAGKGKERASGPDIYDDSDDALAFRDHLLHKLRAGQIAKHRVTAWCPQTGLIAYPAPSSQEDTLERQQQEPTASTSLLPLSSNSSPAICLTLPSLPSASEYDGKASEVSFTLHLPEAPSAVLRNASDASNLEEYISHLSFSPDGHHLAVFTSFTSNNHHPGPSRQDVQSPSIRFLLYQRGDEINTWLCAFDWDSKRAKANLLAASKAGMQGVIDVNFDSTHILDVRWLQQGNSNTGRKAKQGRKRGLDALLDFSGTSTLAAVLQSNEVLLIHLPYQAIQPQIFVTPLDCTSTTAQDLAGLGTSFSPIPTMNLNSEAKNSNGLLNGGVLDSLGMNLNSTMAGNPLQSTLGTGSSEVANLGAGASFTQMDILGSLTNTKKAETRLASIGPSSTRQISNNIPEGPPILVSEFLIAYQETYQPKLLRQQPASDIAGQDNPVQSNGTGMQVDNVAIDNNALMEQINQHINNSVQNVGQSNTAAVPQTSAQDINQNFGLPDIQSYGQSTGFETGYGDINLSALDELFDSDFGGGSSGGDVEGNNVNLALGGLSSTLSSINEDFASSFPSATEPDGAPSPIKKETSSSNGNNAQIDESSGNITDSNIGNVTNKSDSPSKSMIDGTYGSNSLESRGSSPRKSLNLNGSEDGLLPEYLDEMLDGGKVEALSEIEISQFRIEWTEYGILNVGIKPVTKINSQTSCFSETTPAPPPSAITHLHFTCDSGGKEVPTLLALSYPLGTGDTSASSLVQAYSITEEPFELSDAFSSLEGRKADPEPSLLGQTLEWVVKPVDSSRSKNLVRDDRAILDVWERAGNLESVFVDKEGSIWLSHFIK